MDRRLLPLVLLAIACTSATEDPGGGAGGSGGRPPEIPCAEPGRRPGLRSDHDAVYVKSMDTVVMFGGDRAPFDPQDPFVPSVYTDEVWHYQVGCAAWSRIDAGIGPGRRGAYAAAVDEKRERVIVVAGRSGTEGDFHVENDVWAYLPRARSWKRLDATGAPPRARDGHRVIYDAAKDRILLYGGNESTTFGNEVKGDTWELSFTAGENGAWREVPVSGPGARQDFAMAVDPARGVALLAGGARDFVNYEDDLWAFDLANDEWHYVAMLEDARPDISEHVPQRRFWPELVASGDGAFLLFGGHDDAAQGNRNDLWRISLDDSLDGGRWKVLLTGDVDLENPDTTSPERRDEHSLVWTPAGLWLFGGTSDCGPMDDMWMFGSGGWAPLLPATVGETCVRRKTSEAQFCAPLSCAAPL